MAKKTIFEDCDILVVGGGMAVQGGTGLTLKNVLIQSNEAGMSANDNGSSGYGWAAGASNGHGGLG